MPWISVHHRAAVEQDLLKGNISFKAADGAQATESSAPWSAYPRFGLIGVSNQYGVTQFEPDQSVYTEKSPLGYTERCLNNY